jgi:hypothetical protein
LGFFQGGLRVAMRRLDRRPRASGVSPPAPRYHGA